jgi:hypothetical protein
MSSVSDGILFKHHPSILSFMAFILWGCYQLLKPTKNIAPDLFFTIKMVTFYLSFYYLIFGFLISLTFLMIIGYNYLNKKPARPYSDFILIAAAGVACLLAINWVFTGLLEVTPMKLLTKLADEERALNIFGNTGIEFFLQVNNDLKEYNWGLLHLIRSLRYPFSSSLLFFIIVFVFAFCLFVNEIRLNVSTRILLLICSAFFLPLALFVKLFQIDSVHRAAYYSIIYTTLIEIIALQHLLTIAKTWYLKRKYGTMLTSKLSSSTVFALNILVIILSGFLFLYVQLGGMNLRNLLFYYSPRSSLANSLDLVNSKQTNPTLSVKDMMKVRESISENDRIFALSYYFGFIYVFPSSGIISEPTYSFHNEGKDFYSQSAEQILKYLDQNKIKLLIINFDNPVFTNLVKTSLFSAINMVKYFTPVLISGNTYILKIRSNSNEPVVSDYFVTLMELRNTGIINYLFSEKFTREF